MTDEPEVKINKKRRELRPARYLFSVFLTIFILMNI